MKTLIRRVNTLQVLILCGVLFGQEGGTQTEATSSSSSWTFIRNYNHDQSYPSLYPTMTHTVRALNPQIISLLIPRGGGYNHDDYDAGYDPYDQDHDYDDNYDPTPPRTKQPPPKITQRKPHPPSSRVQPHNRRPGHTDMSSSSHSHRSRHSSRSPKRQRPRPTPAHEPLMNTVKNLTQKSISLATSATVSTLKTGGKAAYYLTAPKFVTRKEVCGVWRLDQSIGSAACAANIEFTPRGDAITKYKGEESVTGYLFQSRKWPLSCTIEFEADAFQGPGDEVPVRYYYKGSFRRKIADKNVIKIVGKIYEVKKGRFGRGNICGLEVGSFVARRRIVARKQNQNGPRGMNRGKDAKGAVEDDYDDEDYDYDEDYDLEEFEDEDGVNGDNNYDWDDDEYMHDQEEQ